MAFPSTSPRSLLKSRKISVLTKDHLTSQEINGSRTTWAYDQACQLQHEARFESEAGALMGWQCLSLGE